MIKIDDSYLEDEIRDGFYIPSMTKRTWAMELTVLDLIDSICQKHGITYFADWGTYLGAIRHKGFVPWDDDLDICMHRKELNKFIAVAKDEIPDGYSIMSFHNNDYSWKFIYNIVPNDHMCFTPEYLKSHYSFCVLFKHQDKTAYSQDIFILIFCPKLHKPCISMLKHVDNYFNVFDNRIIKK